MIGNVRPEFSLGRAVIKISFGSKRPAVWQRARKCNDYAHEAMRGGNEDEQVTRTITFLEASQHIVLYFEVKDL